MTSYDNEKKLKQKQKKEEEPNVMAKEEKKGKTEKDRASLMGRFLQWTSLARRVYLLKSAQ